MTYIPRLIDFYAIAEAALADVQPDQHFFDKWRFQPTPSITQIFVGLINVQKDKPDYWAFDLKPVSGNTAQDWCLNQRVIILEDWRLIGYNDDIISLIKLIGPSLTIDRIHQ